MRKFYIIGGKELRGEISIDCAKNAILPIMSACIMIDGQVVLKSIPKYSDVLAMQEIIQNLGGKTFWDNDSLIIDCKELNLGEVPNELAQKARASIFTLGPILARLSSAKVSYPGGCNIGARPIDIHIAGLKSLGARIVEKNGYIYARKEKETFGEFRLAFPSVGATENLIMYSCLGRGKTILHNCAREPEIVDLQNFLNKCGGNVHGAGSDEIIIEGVDKLYSTSYQPIPDRIETGTYMIATAMCGGKVTLDNAVKSHNELLIEKLSNAGCEFEFEQGKIIVSSNGKPISFGEIETAVYPGFPTDLQAQMGALASVSKGYSIISENVFEARFNHVPELIKMGADIKIKNGICVICGKEKLYGADVCATDLRGGASLVLAGLKAEGYSNISNISYIERGYYHLEEKLTKLGADIKIIEN